MPDTDVAVAEMAREGSAKREIAARMKLFEGVTVFLMRTFDSAEAKKRSLGKGAHLPDTDEEALICI